MRSLLEDLATVLRRCKLQEVIGLVKGDQKQLQSRNQIAMERLKGQIKQSDNKELLPVMKVEQDFLKARKMYLEQEIIRECHLNRALKLAKEIDSTNYSDHQLFIKYTEYRREAFLEGWRGNFTKHNSILKEINSLLPNTRLRNILGTRLETERTIPFEYHSIPLSFHSEHILKDFQEHRYTEVIQALKEEVDFDSEIITAICKIEQFKNNLNKHSSPTTLKQKRNYSKYISQWDSLYNRTYNLFSLNYLDTSYLERINESIIRIPVLTDTILLNPVTYDLSSAYINLSSTSSVSRLSTRIKDININQK
ncbi:hypothetical protein NEOKW01_2102 [Nematocida sp. AWRm80]|nr:hypothetical protein NEOKW01_2102 [Nematocida sp. AWRm80]